MTAGRLDKLDIRRSPEEAPALEQNNISELDDLMKNFVRIREKHRFQMPMILTYGRNWKITAWCLLLIRQLHDQSMIQPMRSMQ